MVSFKRNTKLYIVQFTNGTPSSRHRLDIYSDLSASQTLNEVSVRKRTLHRMNDLNEGGIITNANAANFSFTTLIMDQLTYPFIFDLACNINSSYNIDYFDIYLETTNAIYKLEKSVITSLVFNISKESTLTVSISGESSRFYIVPSMPLTESSVTYSPTRLYGLGVSIGAGSVSNILGINIEFVNTINWKNFDTVHNSGSINYPTTYVLESKRVSGSITQLITADNIDEADNSGTSDSLVIDIISEAGQTPSLLKFNLPSIVYTRRDDFGGEFITRAYDYRLNSNSVNVKPIYKGV